MKKKKYIAEGRKVTKKDWAYIIERLVCCYDLLEMLHQNSNLDSQFKGEIKLIQATMTRFENKIYKKSLTKKECLEVYGK